MASTLSTEEVTTAVTKSVSTTAFSVLAALSICHLLNDLVQSLLPAIYPILKLSFHLNFKQIGLITFTFQVAASLFQPVVGYITDKRPMPYSLAIGMGLSLIGLFVVAYASSFPLLLVGAATIGLGSAVFHPESSRMARLASGGQHGLAQSLFQVGGNTGSSIGPLLAAFIVVPHGQHSLSWFSPVALIAMAILANVAGWYKRRLAVRTSGSALKTSAPGPALPRAKVAGSILVLLTLIFSKYFYLVSITSYYTFYLIHRFHLSVQVAQIHLFAFLGAVALGTFIGGPVGDRVGRKYVIWASILGVLPFTLLLPTSNLVWTGALSVVIGFVLASAFSAILVYAQELVPGRIGLISGLFFGFAFGMAGIGAAVLGYWADKVGIDYVYRICSFLPAIGLLAAFLPNLDTNRKTKSV
jgi:FSR family fosmidomycin resistance protein-like MFS transporter